MAKKKAKWLEEGTQEGLLVVIRETLTQDELDPKSVKKALNATNELIERLPSEEITIVDNLNSLVTLANTIQDQYNNEEDMVSEDEAEDIEEDEVDDTEEDEAGLDSLTKKELKAMAKDLGIKVDKKAGKDDIIELIQAAQGEEDSDDEEEDSDEPEASTDVDEILSDLDLKMLKKLAKVADIATKGKKQDALVEELAAHEDIEEILSDAGLLPEEDEEEDSDEDEIDYTELSKAELKSLMKERGFKVSKKTTTEEMIETLENN